MCAQKSTTSAGASLVGSDEVGDEFEGGADAVDDEEPCGDVAGDAAVVSGCPQMRAIRSRRGIAATSSIVAGTSATSSVLGAAAAVGMSVRVAGLSSW